MIEGKMGEVPLANPYYISIDPGITSGICFWDEYGRVTHYNEVDILNLNRLLDHIETIHVDVEEALNLEKFIVEEYRLYQSRALQQSGSRLETVQVIGMIKRSWYSMHSNFDIAEVRADAKSIAAQWSGFRMPSKKSHLPNWQAAYLIGYYWLHNNGVIPARVLEQA